MITLWVAYGAVIAAVAGLVASSVEGVLRGWARPTRHVWAVALVASLLVPAAVAVLALLEAPSALPTAGAVVREVAAGPTAGPATDPASAPDALLARGIELLGPLAPRLASLDRPLGTAWIVASGSALLLLLLGLRAMARRRAAWRRQTVEGRPVLVAPDFGPAVVGVRRPEIVVPEWALRMERRLLQLVLLHEDQHRSAGDTALLTVGVLAVAAAPWNPFLWWQLRRLRLAVEMDCDRRVLGRGVSRVAYGRLLLEVGRRQPRSGLAVAALAEPRSTLERRIRMITTRGSNRSVVRAALGLTLAALLMAMACEMPTPTALDDALEEAEMTRRDLVTVDGEGAFEFRPDVLWILDGVIVSDPSTLVDFDPEEIERIEVLKGAAAATLMGERASGGVVRILTKAAAARGEDLARLDALEDAPAEASAGDGAGVGSIFRAREHAPAPDRDAAAAPLIVVDGVITAMTPDEARGLDAAQIEIITGAAARVILGERAASGVIRITTGGDDDSGS